MLLLAEELLLLALDDERGTVHATAMALDCGLAAALLMELAAAGRLQLRAGRVHVETDGEHRHLLLDDACDAIAAARPHDVGHWVRQLPRSLQGLRPRLLEELVRKGALQRREQRVLLLFHREVFPERDGRVEHDIRSRVDAVLLHGEDGDARTRILAQLAHACRITAALYPRNRRAAVKARIEALTARGDACIGAVGAVNQAVVAASQAAVMAAVIAASVAATTAASSAACSAASIRC